MKQLVLPKGFLNKRMKAIRLHFIGLAGQVTFHARRLSIKLSAGHQALKWLREIKEKINQLAIPPPLY